MIDFILGILASLICIMPFFIISRIKIITPETKVKIWSEKGVVYAGTIGKAYIYMPGRHIVIVNEQHALGTIQELDLVKPFHISSNFILNQK